jgi:hypothetical protein
MCALARANSKSHDIEWIEASAQIVSSEFRYANSSDPEALELDKSYYSNCFSYVVDGKTYFDEFESYLPHEIGQTIEISYNPRKPQENSWTAKSPAIAARVVGWILGIAFGIIITYLADKFGLQGGE